MTHGKFDEAERVTAATEARVQRVLKGKQQVERISHARRAPSRSQPAPPKLAAA